LADEVEGLTPGAALDLGCGEGSDAVWLANRGWRVTAVDISQVALDRGRAADTTGTVTWLQADLLAWRPPADAFDLVSAHFVHFLPAERKRLWLDLAQAVRPNGTLLIVGHHPSDLETTASRWPEPDFYYTADDVAAILDENQWEIITQEARPRQITDAEGRVVTIHDAILRARRR
jgi:SAM-dependent methyltransferase